METLELAASDIHRVIASDQNHDSLLYEIEYEAAGHHDLVGSVFYEEGRHKLMIFTGGTAVVVGVDDFIAVLEDAKREIPPPTWMKDS